MSADVEAENRTLRNAGVDLLNRAETAEADLRISEDWRRQAGDRIKELSSRLETEMKRTAEAMQLVKDRTDRGDSWMEMADELEERLKASDAKYNDMQRWANEAFAERDSLRLKLEDETTRRQNAEVARRQSEARLRTLAIGMVGARMAHVEEDYAEAYHLLYSAARALSDDPLEPWKAVDALAAGAIERRDGQTFVNLPRDTENQRCFEPCPVCRSNDVVLYEPPLHPPPAVYYCRACSAQWSPVADGFKALAEAGSRKLPDCCIYHRGGGNERHECGGDACPECGLALGHTRICPLFVSGGVNAQEL